jgi:hypothetical protein
VKVSDIVKGGTQAMVGKFMHKVVDPVNRKIIQDLFNPVKHISIEKQKKAPKNR